MIELKKKDKESTQSLLRRFSKKMRQSGILFSARRQMFHRKAKTKRQTKDSALRREYLRDLRSELVKLGEIEPGKKMDLSKLKR